MLRSLVGSEMCIRDRFSLILLRIFRNFTNHLTNAECKDIDEGSIEDSEISLFCKSWTDILKTFKFSIEQVLKFLKDKNIISEKEMKFHKKFMDKTITAKQRSELDFDVQEQLNRIENKIDAIFSTGKKEIK